MLFWMLATIALTIVSSYICCLDACIRYAVFVYAGPPPVDVLYAGEAWVVVL